MLEDVQLTLELADDSMKKAISHLETELTKIRAGKANPQSLMGLWLTIMEIPRPLTR